MSSFSSDQIDGPTDRQTKNFGKVSLVNAVFNSIESIMFETILPAGGAKGPEKTPADVDSLQLTQVYYFAGFCPLFTPVLFLIHTSVHNEIYANPFL